MSDTPDANLEAVDIVNRALARFAATPLETLDDDSELAQAAQLIYLTDVEAALGKLPWRFASKKFKLSQLAPPESGWAYAYELPGGMLGLPEKYLTNPRNPESVLREFEVGGGELHCDRDQIWAVGTVMVAPTFWPPEFRKAIIVGLASALCIPLTHDMTLSAALAREAYGDPREGGTGGLLGRAIAREVANAPPQVDLYSDNPLTDARW